MRLLFVALLFSAHLAAADELPPTELDSPPLTVPVTFRGPSNFRVLVDQKFCAAPCVLDLAPGPAHLLVVGESNRGLRAPEFEEELAVPDRPATIVVDTNYRMKRIVGRALLAGGLAVSVVGAIVLGIGRELGAGMQGSPATSMQSANSGAVSAMGGVYLALGIGVGIAGAVLLGMPEGKLLDVRTASGLHLTGISAAPLPGGGGGGALAFTF